MKSSKSKKTVEELPSLKLYQIMADALAKDKKAESGFVVAPLPSVIHLKDGRYFKMLYVPIIFSVEDCYLDEDEDKS